MNGRTNGRTFWPIKELNTSSRNEVSFTLNVEFQLKKPMLNGSKKMAYGDNIYHQTSSGVWMLSNSHHTYPDGSINRENLSTDTGQTNNVLISNEFV